MHFADDSFLESRRPRPGVRDAETHGGLGLVAAAVIASDRVVVRAGAAERDHWLLHMAAAVERCTPPGEIRDMLMGYFVPAAEHMRNDGSLNIVKG